ncbi:hypothetical protein BZA77DRAFT_353656 [Pyronema omphalodes]|nr:hypothetical protein BZA77DRAFT_353656 [Pyronema omphalodes]
MATVMTCTQNKVFIAARLPSMDNGPEVLPLAPETHASTVASTEPTKKDPKPLPSLFADVVKRGSVADAAPDVEPEDISPLQSPMSSSAIPIPQPKNFTGPPTPPLSVEEEAKRLMSVPSVFNMLKKREDEPTKEDEPIQEDEPQKQDEPETQEQPETEEETLARNLSIEAEAKRLMRRPSRNLFNRNSSTSSSSSSSSSGSSRISIPPPEPMTPTQSELDLMRRKSEASASTSRKTSISSRGRGMDDSISPTASPIDRKGKQPVRGFGPDDYNHRVTTPAPAHQHVPVHSPPGLMGIPVNGSFSYPMTYPGGPTPHPSISGPTPYPAAVQGSPYARHSIEVHPTGYVQDVAASEVQPTVQDVEKGRQGGILGWMKSVVDGMNDTMFGWMGRKSSTSSQQ